MNTPQCVRCGEFEMIGVVHVCADVFAQVVAPIAPGIAARMRPCPNCGQPMGGSVPAGALEDALPPCGMCNRPLAACTCSWRDRPKLL